MTARKKVRTAALIPLLCFLPFLIAYANSRSPQGTDRTTIAVIIDVKPAELLAKPAHSNWPAHNSDYTGQRFSTLEETLVEAGGGTMDSILIAFRGGKAIRGPQCAGMLVGRKEFVASALLNNSPHEDTLGRSQKVGKEEIVGMVKALECYLNEDHAALDKEWRRRLDAISAAITRVPGVTTSFFVPDVANHVPHLNITWDPRKIVLTPQEAHSALSKGKPAIVLDSSEHGLAMNSFMLQPGEETIIAAQLAQLFKAHAA